MRRIISAQSWDSVPPAPGFMVIKQELRSWGPESMRWNSAASTSLINRAVMSPTSTRVPASWASSPNSIITRISSVWRISPSQIWTIFSSVVRFLMISWDFFVSSQNPGTAMIDSISMIDSRLASTSKRPPKLGDPLFTILQLCYFFTVHGYGSLSRLEIDGFPFDPDQQGYSGGQQYTEPGREVSDREVERSAAPRLDFAGAIGFHKQGCHGTDMAVLINNCGYACVCGADQRSTGFDRPEGRNGQVLIRRRRAAEPGVVGDCHQDAGAGLDILPGQFRKDDFVTDLNSQFGASGIESNRPLSGGKITDSDYKLVDKGQESTEWYVFAKRNQMQLVGAPERLATRRYHEGAVQKGAPAVAELMGRAAEQQAGIGFPGQSPDPFRLERFILKEKRHRTFRPDDQVYSPFGSFPGEALVGIQRPFAKRRAPFDILGDISLNQRHTQRF